MRAMQNLQKGKAPQPLRFTLPLRVRLDLVQSEMADRAAILPGARRLEAKQIEFSADDPLDAHRAFRAAVALARE